MNPFTNFTDLTEDFILEYFSKSRTSFTFDQLNDILVKYKGKPNYLIAIKALYAIDYYVLKYQIASPNFLLSFFLRLEDPEAFLIFLSLMDNTAFKISAEYSQLDCSKIVEDIKLQLKNQLNSVGSLLSDYPDCDLPTSRIVTFILKIITSIVNNLLEVLVFTDLKNKEDDYSCLINDILKIVSIANKDVDPADIPSHVDNLKKQIDILKSSELSPDNKIALQLLQENYQKLIILNASIYNFNSPLYRSDNSLEISSSDDYLTRLIPSYTSDENEFIKYKQAIAPTRVISDANVVEATFETDTLSSTSYESINSIVEECEKPVSLAQAKQLIVGQATPAKAVKFDCYDLLDSKEIEKPNSIVLQFDDHDRSKTKFFDPLPVKCTKNKVSKSSSEEIDREAIELRKDPKDS